MKGSSAIKASVSSLSSSKTAEAFDDALLERLSSLIGRARTIEEEMEKRLSQFHSSYIELLIEQKVHVKWLEVGEYFKDELRRLVHADKHVKTYFDAMHANAQVKDAIGKKREEAEELRSNVGEQYVVTEEDIEVAEAEVISIEMGISDVGTERLEELEKMIEKTVVSVEEEFYEGLAAVVAKNFALATAEASPSETPLEVFEEETKSFRRVVVKSHKPDMSMHKEEQNANIEKVDSTLKVKSNRLFDMIRRELHSDYGQYLTSIEFDSCCIDCEEAVKIGQLLSEKDSFNLRFIDTKGSVQILLTSIGAKTAINELCVEKSGLQAVVSYLQQHRRVRKIVVKDVDTIEAMPLGILINLIAKNTDGRSLTLREVDLRQIPVMLLKNVISLKEFALVKCQLDSFEKLIEILMKGKDMQTLEIRACMPKEYINYILLAKLLARNSNVVTLNLSENWITPKSLKALGKVMPEVKTMETLIMDHCTYEKECQAELEDALFEIISASKSLKVFSLKGFVLNDDAKAMALLAKWEQQAPNIRSRIELF